MAAFTGDWSDSRWELKPGPIVSMAMMICVAFGGGGIVVSVVSVLCGAGGGLTVQDDVMSISAEIAAITRTVPGTLFRVSARRRAARGKPDLTQQPHRPHPSRGDAEAEGCRSAGKCQFRTSVDRRSHVPARPIGGAMATLEDLEARVAALEASQADYRAVLGRSMRLARISGNMRWDSRQSPQTWRP